MAADRTFHPYLMRWAVVHARQLPHDLVCCQAAGGVQTGKAGDWLVREPDGLGGYTPRILPDAAFQALYRPLPPPGEAYLVGEPGPELVVLPAGTVPIAPAAAPAAPATILAGDGEPFAVSGSGQAEVLGSVPRDPAAPVVVPAAAVKPRRRRKERS